VKRASESGTALVVGLMLLTLVTLLGLAGASAAHVERLLAQHEAFRENAASAASAGIEIALRAIVTSPDPRSVPARIAEPMPGVEDRFEVTIRFAGVEAGLPQAPGEHVAGAHFDIVSTGFSGRAVDRQRADVLWLVDAPGVAAADCEPLAPRHCHRAGEIERISWQREAVE
jgi:hypothetical protein